MEVNDTDLDERLRALATLPPEIVRRVAAQALAASPRSRRRLPWPLMVASAACALLLVVIGLSYWPLRSAMPPVTNLPENVGMVLVRAPDGSSLIFSTGTPADTQPPGSGFVISEGGHR